MFYRETNKQKKTYILMFRRLVQLFIVFLFVRCCLFFPCFLHNPVNRKVFQSVLGI